MRGVLAAVVVATFGVSDGVGAQARAEIAEVKLAFQFGSNYLPLMVMENQKIVEKHLAEKGMKDSKVGWMKLANPGAIIDAYLVGQIHFSGQGVPSTALIWDKTRTTIGAKAVAAMSESNIYLNTRNPNVKSVRDLTEKDRIAIPSLKSSAQAVFLMMAAEKEWGEGQWAKLDHLIISLPHPDALAAMTNPSHEVNAHAATQPFHKMEIKVGARTIATFAEAAGGPATGLNFVSTQNSGTRTRRPTPLSWPPMTKRSTGSTRICAAPRKPT